MTKKPPYIASSDLKTILHSKRANIYYLEHCRVLVNEGSGVCQGSCHCFSSYAACCTFIPFSGFSVTGPAGSQFLTERVPHRDGLRCLACSKMALR